MQENASGNQKKLNSIVDFMPERVKTQINQLSEQKKEKIEEIRIRVNRPVVVRLSNQQFFLTVENHFDNKTRTSNGFVTQQEIEGIVKRMAGYSLYAFEEEFKQGYITLAGGCRIGLAGRTVIKNGEIQTIKQINGLNIRLSREVKGCANKILPFMVNNNMVRNTLILSPPKMGKTTLLRDIVRQISNGNKVVSGKKVVVIDERSEIASVIQGIPQNDIGLRTDVIDGCPKKLGIMMALRTLSPEVIVTDEIGKIGDAEAIEEALNSGVSIITTAHARNLNDALQRKMLSFVIESKYFERIVILSNRAGTGTIEQILDGEMLTEIIRG